MKKVFMICALDRIRSGRPFDRKGIGREGGFEALKLFIEEKNV
ncbi:MAG: hypothetical protein WBD22_00260 [Pyrinomonadaceae bacterium]